MPTSNIVHAASAVVALFNIWWILFKRVWLQNLRCYQYVGRTVAWHSQGRSPWPRWGWHWRWRPGAQNFNKYFKRQRQYWLLTQYLITIGLTKIKKHDILKIFWEFCSILDKISKISILYFLPQAIWNKFASEKGEICKQSNIKTKNLKNAIFAGFDVWICNWWDRAVHATDSGACAPAQPQIGAAATRWSYVVGSAWYQNTSERTIGKTGNWAERAKAAFATSWAIYGKTLRPQPVDVHRILVILRGLLSL